MAENSQNGRISLAAPVGPHDLPQKRSLALDWRFERLGYSTFSAHAISRRTNGSAPSRPGKGQQLHVHDVIDEVMDRTWRSSCFSRRGMNGHKPQGQAQPNVLLMLAWRWAGILQDGAGQACRPYPSVTVAAKNFLRPALPGLVPWATHQS
jgi:hypothetical protein